MEPSKDKEVDIERRRLQNRIAQRRFRERHKNASEETVFMLNINGIPNNSEPTVTTQALQQTSPLLPRTPSPNLVSSLNGDLDHGLFVSGDMLQDMEISGQETDLDLSYLLSTDLSWTDSGQVLDATTNPHLVRCASIASGHEQGRTVESAPSQAMALTPQSSPSLPPTRSLSDVSEKWQGPLHMAARNGNDNITRLLVRHGVDCHEKDSEGHTPLMLAVAGGYEDVTGTLLSHGAHIDDTDDELRSVIHLAVIHRRRDLLKMLLNHRAGDAAVINSYDLNGKTPLHMAIDIGFEAGVQELLLAGADVKSKARRH